MTHNSFIICCPGIETLVHSRKTYYQRNATNQKDSNEANSPVGTVDISKKRDDDVALTMDDERFADAVRSFNQGTHEDYRSVAKKIFKRLKHYGGRLLQANRSGLGRSPIIGYTSLNDVDAKDSEFVCRLSFCLGRDSFVV